MKTVIALIVLVVLLGAAGFLSFRVAAFERDMATVDEDLSTQQYVDAASMLTHASADLRWTGWLPTFGARARADIKMRQASLQYWQQQYKALMPREADPVGAVEAEDVGLQMLVANGVYRAGQIKAKDREQSIQALQDAVSGYMTVLKGPAWDERAAYNYEFLVRVRDELRNGKRKALPPPPMEQQGNNGEAGEPFEPTNTKAFEIYIPLEEQERTKASEAGKASPNQRKG
jgi:hypothetical protein